MPIKQQASHVRDAVTGGCVNILISNCEKNRIGDCELILTEVALKPVFLSLAIAERSGLQSQRSGVRANNPDPVQLRMGDRDCAECNLCAQAHRASDPSSAIWKIESGTPTKGLEEAKARFFAIVDGMESLRKLLGINRFADIPKTPHNIAVVAHHLFAEKSISHLFDTVINVQEIVEACWNAV